MLIKNPMMMMMIFEVKKMSNNQTTILYLLLTIQKDNHIIIVKDPSSYLECFVYAESEKELHRINIFIILHPFLYDLVIGGKLSPLVNSLSLSLSLSNIRTYLMN